MKAYFWVGHRNFGDRLTGTLLERLGIPYHWSPVWEADFVACGSVLTHLPKGWTGTVWGTGKARKIDKINLSQMRVLALRGALTAKDSHARPGYVLGDPGLLANLLATPSEEVELGIVPHWEDKHLARYFRGEVIDVTQEPDVVIRQIARCKRIVSSSLHGIIVADALGIERRWERFTKIQGGGFKFVDYGTVVGHFEPKVWGRANPVKVRQAANALRQALQP